MKMAENTYWTNKQAAPTTKPAIARSGKPGADKAKGTTAPQWWAFGVMMALTLMLCLTINFRAFSEMNKESVQNSSLENQIQTMTGLC